MRNGLLKKLGAAFNLLMVAGLLSAGNSPIELKVNSSTGALSELKIQRDVRGMNWLVRVDGTQYAWVNENYGWGLGYFTVTKGRESIKKEWKNPVEISADGMNVIYRESDIRIQIKRRLEEDGLVERYTFTNIGEEAVSLYDIGIYTPFNDNYPSAQECMNSRANVQIWEGGNAAYVNAIRMGAYVPHLGLMVTEGAVKSYEIWERGRRKANSHTRGIFALNMPDMQLKPGESYSLEWYIFAHEGNDDFCNKLLERGSVLVSCDKYVYQKGEVARVELRSLKPLKTCRAMINGVPVAVKRKGNRYIIETPVEQAGEVRFDFYYNGNRQTHADCLIINSTNELIQKRVNFIRTNQQMNNPADLRDGAYMVYDNEGDSIYLNDTPNCNPVDRDEGAERLGMGVLLAKQYLLTKDSALKESLLRYARFVRHKLQTDDYVTYSSVDQKQRNRGYNYMWVAEFYFQMYKVTGDRLFVTDGYKTLKSMFRQFGHGFYAIGIPVRLGLQSLKEAGMEKEYKDLLKDFIRTGDIFVENGLNYPAHEVNYEQSIVAPAILFLAQLYLETGIQKYLDEVKRQMPVLEAFNGFQPSYHLNEVAIRHWDGHWFGKREMFGDTFPHYWSTVTGAVYYYYALCTGDASYQVRAENVVRNNLCLFFEDGRASCAYMYPYKIDGVKAQFYDPYANDQDWALVYYLLVNKGL
ncbi:six-hairpin glycosidase [Bacteroides intestinalis]|jgi:hypothetical protein|uniref:Six-hairpin glycosidase n=2 Tax=Bacteroides intestinalis TaxID=329854 RepID=A0AB37MGT6_9BACE|nr:six-hairpin glycosidase [Bacteroides intestinalis]